MPYLSATMSAELKETYGYFLLAAAGTEQALKAQGDAIADLPPEKANIAHELLAENKTALATLREMALELSKASDLTPPSIESIDRVTKACLESIAPAFQRYMAFSDLLPAAPSSVRGYNKTATELILLTKIARNTPSM